MSWWLWDLSMNLLRTLPPWFLFLKIKTHIFFALFVFLKQLLGQNFVVITKSRSTWSVVWMLTLFFFGIGVFGRVCHCWKTGAVIPRFSPPWAGSVRHAQKPWCRCFIRSYSWRIFLFANYPYCGVQNYELSAWSKVRIQRYTCDTANLPGGCKKYIPNEASGLVYSIHNT